MEEATIGQPTNTLAGLAQALGIRLKLDKGCRVTGSMKRVIEEGPHKLEIPFKVIGTGGEHQRSKEHKSRLRRQPDYPAQIMLAIESEGDLSLLASTFSGSHGGSIAIAIIDRSKIKPMRLDTLASYFSFRHAIAAVRDAVVDIYESEHGRDWKPVDIKRIIGQA